MFSKTKSSEVNYQPIPTSDSEEGQQEEIKTDIESRDEVENEKKLREVVFDSMANRALNVPPPPEEPERPKNLIRLTPYRQFIWLLMPVIAGVIGRVISKDWSEDERKSKEGFLLLSFLSLGAIGGIVGFFYCTQNREIEESKDSVRQDNYEEYKQQLVLHRQVSDHLYTVTEIAEQKLPMELAQHVHAFLAEDTENSIEDIETLLARRKRIRGLRKNTKTGEDSKEENIQMRR